MKKRPPARTSEKKQVPTARGIPLDSPSRTAVQVSHLDSPPKFVKPRRIHPRRILPLVREGYERGFHSATLAINAPIVRRFAEPALQPGVDILISTNTELSGPGEQLTASNVDEPSVALNGDVVLFTGNWYAAISTDAGKTFQFISPANAFANKDPKDSHFCCDQVAQYISQIDCFVWLLQYGPDKDNLQRLAFARTADAAAGHWSIFDLTTQILGVPGAFLDFPDLAVGANSLYVTTNIFLPDKVGSGVVRIPIQSIEAATQDPASAKAPTVVPFVSFDFQSFRVAQHTGETAFFAAHEDTSTLRVFSWPEGQAQPTSSSVGVARWIGGNGYRSKTPDGRRWLDRADPRITGATLRGDEIWFAWSVDQGSNQRPQPFIQIARIAASNLTLLDNINVFDPTAATCYGAIVANAGGDVGISYAIGGGDRFPSHMVGILTDPRKDALAAAGDRGPQFDPDTGKGEWGDYLTIRRAFPAENQFAATGYTLKGQDSPGEGGRTLDATPRYVVFARTGTGPSAKASGPIAAARGVPAAAGGEPITDVSKLPLVSQEVAAQIKMAAGISAVPLARPLLAPMAPQLVTSPGVERWPVKTGQDTDIALVGKNVIGGSDLGPGIVPSTVEELAGVPRPPEMPDLASLNPAYQARRSSPVEIVIWQLDATITVLKLEADGDYHLVLQGSSGQTIIGEVPTPTTRFIGQSPWMKNISEARKAVDDKLVSPLHPADFVQVGDKLVPRQALTIGAPVQAFPNLPVSFRTPPAGQEATVPPFQTSVPPTRARLTGVGFFDKVHGQTGVSQLNGIELHPILRIEWL